VKFRIKIPSGYLENDKPLLGILFCHTCISSVHFDLLIFINIGLLIILFLFVTHTV